MTFSGRARRFIMLLLPLLCLAGNGLLLGCYYETNDDLTIVALLRGVSAASPVTDLHLYFHGYAALWAWLYTTAPAVPWYGLTLYGLLVVATVLLFAVLDKVLSTRLSMGWVLVCSTLLFEVAWLEHGFWFSYVRIPVLLAGVGLLYAAQRAPGRKAAILGLLAFALAWLIRPSAAVLALLVVAPGAWWLAQRRAVPILASAAGFAVVAGLLVTFTRSDAAATYRRLDVLKSNLNDFHLTAPPARPLSAPDSLGLALTHHWMVGDSTLINEAFFNRATPVHLPYFVEHTALPKLRNLLLQLGRDYFPLLLLLVGTCLVAWRSGQPRGVFWVVQLAFAIVVVGLGVGLKLPPRLALPVLDFWVLGNLIFCLQPAARFPLRSALLLLVLLLVAAVPYAYKTSHRRVVLSAERSRNHERQRLLFGKVRGGILVSDIVEETYKSASPFQEHLVPTQGHLLGIAGWPTLDPSQPVLRHALTDTRDFTTSMRRLAEQPHVAWVLSPEGAALLNRQLALRRQTQQPHVRLQRAPEVGPQAYKAWVEDVK
ncbi:hypothetical protein [Hymenobacter mucosus]|nr:hypothetical protein [Hymenobacter mucosus]